MSALPLEPWANQISHPFDIQVNSTFLFFKYSLVLKTSTHFGNRTVSLYGITSEGCNQVTFSQLGFLNAEM
jgi:hypothetical protein